jgi:hypothetical protein
MTLLSFLWVLLVLAGAFARPAPTWRATLCRFAGLPVPVPMRAARAGRRPWLYCSRWSPPGGFSPGRLTQAGPPGSRPPFFAAPSVSVFRLA